MTKTIVSLVLVSTTKPVNKNDLTELRKQVASLCESLTKGSGLTFEIYSAMIDVIDEIKETQKK